MNYVRIYNAKVKIAAEALKSLEENHRIIIKIHSSDENRSRIICEVQDYEFSFLNGTGSYETKIEMLQELFYYMFRDKEVEKLNSFKTLEDVRNGFLLMNCSLKLIETYACNYFIVEKLNSED